MVGAHRYCCRVSHRPALVSRSLVASTRTMLMKRMKLSCGVRGLSLHGLLAGRGQGAGPMALPRPCSATASPGAVGPRLPREDQGPGWRSAASQALWL